MILTITVHNTVIVGSIEVRVHIQPYHIDDSRLLTIADIEIIAASAISFRNVQLLGYLPLFKLWCILRIVSNGQFQNLNIHSLELPHC